MSADIELQCESPQQSPECPGCKLRDEEIQRLRQQLGVLADTPEQARGFAWWCVFVLGICGISLLPHACIASMWLLNSYDINDETLMGLIFRIAYAIPILQCAILGCCVVLHWRPLWQRLTVGVAATAFCVLIAAASYASLSGDNSGLADMIWVIVPLLPITILIAACPAMIGRAFFGWTLASRGQTVTPAPVTISTYLLLVAVSGLATATLRLVNTDSLGSIETSQLIAIFLMYVGMPAIVTGSVFAAVMPTVLQRTRRSWRGWSARLSLIVVLTVFGPLLAYSSLWFGDASEAELFDFEILYQLFLGSAGTTAVTALLAVAFFWWLRWLDYQLFSKADAPATIPAAVG